MIAVAGAWQPRLIRQPITPPEQMSLADRLSTVQFNVDDTPHIVVDGDRCRPCERHTCLTFCPAQCFTSNEQGGIDYYHLGCLECGTCLLLCSGEAVSWNYPKGGHGVSYRF